MNIVLIHIGKELPDHFWTAVEQVRRFFCGNIHVVIPDSQVSSNEIKRIGVHPYPYERFLKNPLYKRFMSACTLQGFWNVTMGRLIILQLLMMEKFLLDVVHIENDVLIYADPNKYLSAFRQCAGDSVLLCPVGYNHASAAYMYVRTFTALNKLNTLLINYFERGAQFIEKNIGLDVNEMTMIAVFERTKSNIIKYLPTMPEGPGSKNYRMFNSVFDGASAGQYIGGTQSDPPGWAGNHHYLGVDLKARKYSFQWKKENNIRIPFLVQGKKTFRVNNLHIHCKRLKEFI